MPIEQFNDAKYQLAAILVRMSQKNLSLDDANLIASQLHSIISQESEMEYLHVLIVAIEHHAKEIPVLKIILKKIIEIIPLDKWQLRARAEEIRYTLLKARPSGFENKNLVELGLPLINEGSL